MAIKTVTNPPIKPSKVDYPMLMQHISGAIMLVHAPGFGYIVQKSRNGAPYSYGTLNNIIEYKDWVPFEGSITLSNDL